MLRKVSAIRIVPWRIRSETAINDTSEESLSRAIKKPPTVGMAIRIAWGSVTRRNTSKRDMPKDRPASFSPLSTELSAARNTSDK